MLKTLGNVLIITGILTVILGLVLKFSGKFMRIGKLPGDVVIQKGNFTFIFPVVTCLLISLILSLLLYLIFKFILKG